MVTVERVESRDELAVAMGYLSETAARFARSGHVGTHLSCIDCERYLSVRDEQDDLLTDWQEAPAE